VMARTQTLLSCVALLLCVGLACADTAWWCDGGENESRLSTSLNNFYLHTAPLSWRYTHLWGSEECPCQWFGVDCSGKNGTVSLHLENNHIEGMVDSSFCDDIYSEINFSNNSLAGVLPTCFGNMKQLQGLYLSDNEFQGLLPDSLGTLSHLRRLEIARNRFAGPFPDYLQCPYFFFGDKVHVEIKNNSFWCPSPEWCQKNQCNFCISEPSPACTNQNKAACNAELQCCYEKSWEQGCDDYIEKMSIECVVEEVLPEGCDPSYKPDKNDDDGNSMWWLLPAGLALLAVIGAGCLGTVIITVRKRDWSFRQQRKELIQVDSDTYMIDPDDDIYQDEMPPRSSLDYEL